MMDDELLEFNFGGVEPATFTGFVAMPKGEYNLQCTGGEKFYAKDKNSGQPNPNRPGLRFNFVITGHDLFTGTERSIWHMLEEKSMPFLLNTLMCLVPEQNWQRDGIKVPLSQLFQAVQGRPANGLIDWEINVKDGKRYVNNKLTGLKKFDPSITQPVPSEGNPPTVDNSEVSATTQNAAAGVPQNEVNAFLNDWPGSPDPAPQQSSSTESVLDFGF